MPIFFPRKLYESFNGCPTWHPWCWLLGQNCPVAKHMSSSKNSMKEVCGTLQSFIWWSCGSLRLSGYRINSVKISQIVPNLPNLSFLKFKWPGRPRWFPGFAQASSAYDLDPVTTVRSFSEMAKIPEFSCFKIGPKRIQTMNILAYGFFEVRGPEGMPWVFPGKDWKVCDGAERGSCFLEWKVPEKRRRLHL